MKNLFLIEHIPTQKSNICYLSYHRANFEKWKSVYSSTVCTLCVGCNASPRDVESSTQRWINMTTKFVLRSDIEWKRWEIVRNQPYRRKCHNGLIWCSSESYELYPWSLNGQTIKCLLFVVRRCMTNNLTFCYEIWKIEITLRLAMMDINVPVYVFGNLIYRYYSTLGCVSRSP